MSAASKTSELWQQLEAAIAAGVAKPEAVYVPPPAEPAWWRARDRRTNRKRYARLASFVGNGIEVQAPRGRRKAADEAAYLRAYADWYQNAGKRQGSIIILPLDVVMHCVTFRDEHIRLRRDLT